jgi:plasmid stability protein
VPTICIKNFPDDLYAWLKKSAARHGRSISAEVIWLVEQALRLEEEKLSNEPGKHSGEQDQ